MGNMYARTRRRQVPSPPAAPALARARREVRMLSVAQPWAGFYVAGIIDVMSRSWPVPDALIAAGLDLYIHATGRDRLDRDAAERMGFPLGELQCSAVLGVVTVTACVRDHPSRWAQPGRWHWVLDDAEALDHPVTGVQGHPGLRRPPPRLFADVELRLGRQRRKVSRLT